MRIRDTAKAAVGLLSFGSPALSLDSFFTWRYFSFRRATRAVIFSLLGPNFPFSDEATAVRLASEGWPVLLGRGPVFCEGHEWVCSTGGGFNYLQSGFQSLLRRLLQLLFYQGSMRRSFLEELHSLSLTDLTYLGRGRKVARISPLVRRWISDFMVDSSLPKVACFLIFLISSLSTLSFQKLYLFRIISDSKPR